jgi:hypothetical protein
MAFFCILSTFWISWRASRRMGPKSQQRGTGITADHHHNIVSGCGLMLLGVARLDEPPGHANAHDDKPSAIRDFAAPASARIDESRDGRTQRLPPARFPPLFGTTPAMRHTAK